MSEIKIREINDVDGNVIYPITSGNAVYLNDGTPIETVVSTIDLNYLNKHLIFTGTQAEFDADLNKENYLIALITE